MKKFLMLILALVATGVFLATRAPAADVEGFHKTWGDAKAAAEADNKPIYLHFTTTWCGWCRKIEKDVYGSAAGKAALKPFVAASLDCTVPSGKTATGETKLNLELLAKWGGSGYPFLVMVTPDGAVLHSFAGYRPVAAFKAELAKALAVHREYLAFQAEAAKADPGSYEHQVKAMALYAKVRKHDLAAAAAEKVRTLDPDNAKGHAAHAAAVLLAAAEGEGDDAKARAALADIRKFDPHNKEGLWEKSVFNHALKTLQAGRRLSGEARNERLRRAVADLTALTSAGVKLTSAQNAHHLLGFLHMALGAKDEARAALRKALAADPNSRTAATIRKRIDALDEETGK